MNERRRKLRLVRLTSPPPISRSNEPRHFCAIVPTPPEDCNELKGRAQRNTQRNTQSLNTQTDPAPSASPIAPIMAVVPRDESTALAPNRTGKGPVAPRPVSF